MQNNDWDKNVDYRIQELEGHFDKTYWELLVPLYEDKISKENSNYYILDVGCGLGYLTNELSNINKNIIGIDASVKSVHHATQRFPNTKFYHSTIKDYQHNNQKKFDICISNMVFHNIEKLDENIESINKLLVMKGKLIFSIPNPAIWYVSRRHFNDKDYKYGQIKPYAVPFQINGGEIHPSLIVYWHRPLEYYSKILKENGFITIEQIEPSFSGNHKKDILFWICEKIIEI
jgi:2-polyprenyl-3-methyl-5-hydroxy-6-metoxy-1,4-benzoquinol methylase